jgi:hypothetical protein
MQFFLNKISKLSLAIYYLYLSNLTQNLFQLCNFIYEHANIVTFDRERISSLIICKLTKM